MVKVVLTADRSVFTDYSGCSSLGFGLCLPYRLIPRFLEYRVLAPPIPVVDGYRAKYAPYPLAKIEASLLSFGFSRDEVAIVPPERLNKVVNEDTLVLGMHVLDPQGLAPVSWTLRVLTGGGRTCTQYEFETLMRKVKKLKEKYKFKVVAGGPGVWQLKGLERGFGIDVIYEGEAEFLFPLIVSKIVNGEEVPNYVKANPAPIEKIPPIVTPSRNGIVEITRGCPRRCMFCSPTMSRFRSIPLELILKEVEVVLSAGIDSIGFVTEDVYLYGAHGLKINSDAIKELFMKSHSVARKYGITKIGFSHVTTSSALVDRSVAKFISDINCLSKDDPLLPQVGLESGSPRIVGTYFRGKVYPWRPEDWHNIVIEASKLFNDNYWYPCYTYIIGFPGEREEDVRKTIELLYKLKDEGFEGWTFPLLLVPIGNTLIHDKADFKSVKDLSEVMIEAIVVGWRISLEFSRRAYRYLTCNVKNYLIRGFLNAMVDKALNALEVWVDRLEGSVEVFESFSRVNIRSAPRLVHTLISNALKVKI